MMAQLQPALSLLGVMTLEEAGAQMEATSGPGTHSPEALASLWGRSRDSFKPVCSNPGFPEIRELPASARGHLIQVPKHGSFGPMVAGFGWSIRIVEIRPLLSLAIHVSLPRVEHWVERLAKAETASLLEGCLPLRADVLQLNSAGPGAASLVHSDLGVTWMVNFQNQVGAIPVAPPLAVRVAEVNGRMFLFDGYHRAAALLRLGQEWIPCVILHDCNWTFLRQTPRGHRFEPSPFSRPDPPCVGHFATPAAVPTLVRREVRVMTVRFESMIATIE